MDFWWRPVSSSLFFFFLFLFLFFCAIVRPLTVAIAARRNGPFAATIIGCFYRAPFWFFFFFLSWFTVKRKKKKRRTASTAASAVAVVCERTHQFCFGHFFFLPLETPKKYKKKTPPSLTRQVDRIRADDPPDDHRMAFLIFFLGHDYRVSTEFFFVFQSSWWGVVGWRTAWETGKKRRSWLSSYDFDLGFFFPLFFIFFGGVDSVATAFDRR